MCFPSFLLHWGKSVIYTTKLTCTVDWLIIGVKVFRFPIMSTMWMCRSSLSGANLDLGDGILESASIPSARLIIWGSPG